jgi:hypothetical protein
MTRQVLIDRVVDRFPNKMVEAGSVVRITDVHARPLPHRLEPFEHLNCAVIVV